MDYFFNILRCLLLSTSFDVGANVSANQEKPAIQQAISFRAIDDISQYWLSEKLDGMRGYWDGEQLLSRQGNVIHSPKWFTKHWPKTVMDGELWIGRSHFQTTLSCVRKTNIDETCWRQVRFMVFDLPKHTGTFTKRVKMITALINKTTSPYLDRIKQFKLKTHEQLDIKLNEVIANKGEGLMLHLGSAYYHAGRTANIMKLKKHQDAEAKIIAHISGKGKYRGKLGAIKVEIANGIIFKIGSGFTDQERSNPPPIGSTITFKYNGLTKAGIPRFARFWRIREAGKKP